MADRTDTARFSLGDLELVALHDGYVRLDGGAMFGVVPKTAWERHLPADSRNRVRLALRPLLIRGARTALVDAGIGDKEDENFSEMYALERASNLEATMAEAGVAPEAIDLVVATHLHFDHAGGFTVRDAGGRLRPRFPRARYLVRRGEWDDATHPHERNRASYRPDNFLPLAEAGVIDFIDDDQAIMPGVRVRRTGGHTRHHQVVDIESGGRVATYVADLIPTTAHLPPAWIMAFDLYPVDALTARKAFLRDAIDRQTLVFFAHDPATAAAYLREEGRRVVAVPANPEDPR